MIFLVINKKMSYFSMKSPEEKADFSKMKIVQDQPPSPLYRMEQPQIPVAYLNLLNPTMLSSDVKK
jgi:hypothetical protein